MPTLINQITSIQPDMLFDLSDTKRYTVNIAENLESWARSFAEKSGLLEKIPDNVRPYFNYAAWARDALQNGDILALDLFEDAIAVFYRSGYNSCSEPTQ